ncbi:MAG: response regulator transcription factor, partial [Chthoniobacterales bacterium]|nr:response regulator transcription factor [Chthoniobacterales bacterium]
MRRNGQRGGAQRQTPYTVLIVDDDELIRRGIAAIISDEPDFSVCGFAGSENTAVKLLERHQPDLLLLDLSLGHRDGVQFLKDIAGRFAGTLIIALSDYGDKLYATRALHAGASGYLTKHASAAQLITTVRAVAAGKRPLRGPG